MRKSKVLEKLRRNELALMVGVGFAPSSAVSELAGKLGFDGIWIDMEHRPLTLGCLSAERGGGQALFRYGRAFLQLPQRHDRAAPGLPPDQG